MSEVEPGGRFVPQRPFKLGRDAPRKLAARNIIESEVRTLLDEHVVIDVIEERDRYVLLGRVEGRALMAVVAASSTTHCARLGVRTHRGPRLDNRADRTHAGRRRHRGGPTVTRHTHDEGQLASRPIDYDHVVHHDGDDPGLLVVTDVPAQVCQVCDEYWFDESVGFALSRLLQQQEPGSGEVRTVSWIEADAA